jgi:hypothetical protein
MDEGREKKNVKMHEEVLKLHSNFTNPKYEILNHKQIQNPNDKNSKFVVDHVNGDGRDNRVSNLRAATYSQNSQNRRKSKKRCGSKYKGVWLDKRSGRWRAQICFDGDRRHLGYYGEEEAAARAYDRAAVRYHGEFARVNFESSRGKVI